ncbi:hypothetical protein [Branchiibius cervicis]|uniref:Uncharacterized protein n=1 Tax=Branchiibius cervicis TaxID=908252 RepID=A0ABW2ATW4_9MICO
MSGVRRADRRGPPQPDPAEVGSAQWEPWETFAAEVVRGREVSPWCAEQVPLLVALGPDPLDWPTAPDGDLPAAARPLDEGAA